MQSQLRPVIGMGMFSDILGARMVPASLMLFTFVMLIFGLIFNLIRSRITLPVFVSFHVFNDIFCLFSSGLI